MKQHRFYTNSEATWSAMLAAIRQAEKSVYLEAYILEDDLPPEFDFFEVLKERARRGVKVHIVLDGFGSMELSDEAVDELRDAGVEVLFFNNWFRRIHRKILIVDEGVAFLGGVNIGREYRKWLDLHIRLTGRKIVRTLLKSFSHTYFYCGGTEPRLVSYHRGTKIRRAELWLLENFPWTGRLMLRPYYKEQIARAKEKIVLVTPYFIPHGWLITALKKAQARGVSVEIIVPERTDSWFITSVNHIFMASLERAGIKFFLTKDMIHAKAILVDDRVGLVGSNNIDAMSFDYNVESCVSFEQQEMVRDLKNIIEVWKSDSTLFVHGGHREAWYFKALEVLARLIQPIL